MIFEAICAECKGVVAVSKDVPQKDILDKVMRTKFIEQVKRAVGCRACGIPPGNPKLSLEIRPQQEPLTKKEIKEMGPFE